MSDTRTQHSLVIAVLLYFIMVVMAAFNEVPVSQEVPVGSEAVFRCRHSAADIIRWRVNETLIGRNPPPDITPSTTRDEEDNLVDTLTVVARLEYSGTVVVCVAQFDDGTRLSSEPPASLLVQGTFIEDPVSQTVFVGDTAMFRCRHSMTNVIDWILNGTMVIDATTSMPGIVPGMMSESGSMVNTLNITAQRKHNATEIVARARLRGDSSEDSRPAMLQVIVPFVEDPQSLNVTVGEEAVFRCRHPNTLAIGWTVNGPIFSDLQNLDFRLGIVDHVHSLTITAHARYNSSEIQCVATFLNDRSNIPSPSAVLQIQGPLDAVASLTKVNTTISWSAPFSLNLTGIEPDIVYCVDVYNITCGGRDLVSSDCSVTDTSYTSLSDGYLYEYIVTPRSNAEGAQNGTESQPLKDVLPTFSFSSFELSFASFGSQTNCQIQLSYTPAVPIPSSYTLLLEPLDRSGDPDHVEVTAIEIWPNLLLSAIGHESRRLWNCTILAFGCIVRSLLSIQLSTHDFQDISISSPSAGVVRVTGRFVEGSPSTGVLVIVSGDSGATYHISSINDSAVTIPGLAGGEYTVSVFVVEENGLPFERAAIIPEHLSIENNIAEVLLPTIEYTVESTSTGVCVTCNFLDTDASECIAVVHRNLTNIESRLSRKFTRSGDTASGCIEGVNLEDYQVGVVGGRLSIAASSSSVCIGCISGSVLAVILLVCAALVVIVIVCVVRNHCRKKSGRHNRLRSVMIEESGLRCNANYYEPINQQDEKKQESTPLVPRVRADSPDRRVVQLQPESLTIQLKEASFTTPPVTPQSASDDVCQTGAPPESAYAEPALLVKPSVSIPPVTEPSPYSNVEKFQNPQGLTYALLEHVSQKQHDPRPDDRYTANSDYSEVVIKTEECSKTKDKKVDPKSVPPPTPCDIESVGKLLHPITDKWEKFALSLSLDDDHIDNINTGNATDEACLQDVVERYFDNGDFKHNWEEIVAILRGVDEQLADKIHDLHVYPSKSDYSEVQMKKVACSKSEENKDKVVPQSVPSQPFISVPPPVVSHGIDSQVMKTEGADDKLNSMENLKKITGDDEPINSDICLHEVEQPLQATAPTPLSFTADNIVAALQTVASKWQAIGEVFKLSEKRLETTERDEECLREMIEAYMLRRDFNHTWDEIVNLLKKIEEDRLAEQIHINHVAPYVLTLPSQPQSPQSDLYTHGSKPLTRNVSTNDGSLDTASPVLSDKQTSERKVKLEEEESLPTAGETLCTPEGHHGGAVLEMPSYDDDVSSSESKGEATGDILEKECGSNESSKGRVGTDGDSGVCDGRESSLTLEREDDMSSQVMDADSSSVESEVKSSSDVEKATHIIVTAKPAQVARELSQEDYKSEVPLPSSFNESQCGKPGRGEDPLASTSEINSSFETPKRLYTQEEGVSDGKGNSSHGFDESGYLTASCLSTGSSVDNITAAPSALCTPSSCRDHKGRDHKGKGRRLLHKNVDNKQSIGSEHGESENKRYKPSDGAAITGGPPPDLFVQKHCDQENVLVEDPNSKVLVTQQPKSRDLVEVGATMQGDSN